MKSLAERLVWARTQANLSQQALANRAGVSQGTIGNLESNARQGSTRITAIAAALGVNGRWLAEGRGEPYPSNDAASQATRQEQASPQRTTHPNRHIQEVIRLMEETDDEGRVLVKHAAMRALEQYLENDLDTLRQALAIKSPSRPTGTGG